MDLTRLFLDHLSARLAYAEQALEATGFDELVVSSGEPFTYFADDQQAPFHTVPHFRHYCPLEGPHHVLRLRPGRKPQLIRYAPEDYWYEQLPLGSPFWAEGFEILEVPTVEAVWTTLGQLRRAAYIGNEVDRARTAGLDVNPAGLTARLDWGRSCKTPYEIQSLEEATELGARGHMAGRKAFLAGASELEIHHAFVQAVGCLDHQLAFASITALEPKGATLHYENKRSFRNGKVLLLDCGARVRDYASDITRTTLAPGCDSRFASLLAGLEALQLETCANLKPGVPFGEIHGQSMLRLGAVLQGAGILKCGPEEAASRGFIRPFMPHGLGHHLGIMVHDVGGRLASPDGTFQDPPPEHPTLRTTRILAPGHVLTVEPGLYFIPMLLRPLREGASAASFDWKLIDELIPLGGMRIEDNVLLTEDGNRNLTRAYLPD
ncbi:MAG TPA: Xaa-Pro dipeptidase [Holophaga sp.]|nr:Xaa-Pro dipeptidase [Holophaga sp.]